MNQEEFDILAAQKAKYIVSGLVQRFGRINDCLDAVATGYEKMNAHLQKLWELEEEKSEAYDVLWQHTQQNTVFTCVVVPELLGHPLADFSIQGYDGNNSD